MGTENTFATTGKSIKRSSLVQQAKVHASQARDEGAELAKFGWPASRSEELENRTDELETLISTQSAAREEARLAGENLRLVLKDGGTYVRRLRAALRPILRALPPADTTRTMFKAGQCLHNSVQNLSAYFARIRPGIEHLTPQLQAVLPGAAPLDVLDQLRAKLDAASTTAAVARNRLPQLTRDIDETKGRVMTDLRDLVQFARVAFDSEPERMRKFVLDFLRPRSSRDTADQEGEGPQGSSNAMLTRPRGRDRASGDEAVAR